MTSPLSPSSIKAAIIGASGYTGEETVRLLLRHPRVEIVALGADRKAGLPYGAVYPHLDGRGLPDLCALEDIDFTTIDVAFCCLPHGTTQQVVADLFARYPRLKIVDLSADFRLRDGDLYATWYGHPHQALELQKEAVYGLSEFSRDALKSARLVACPGCYPTSALLPLLPLVGRGLIDDGSVIIDAKTGATGGGRSAKENLLHGEMGEGLSAYAIAHHRHAPEMEQALSQVANAPLTVTFTPHLAPMSRGILATIYATLGEGETPQSVHEALTEHYRGEPFVRVLPWGAPPPATQHVRGSNYVHIAVFADRKEGRVIIVSVIDNLVKGSSGQAVQNMNVMYGFDETEGLMQAPLFP
ncbi:N-acetyl-gamma-glutamyl-phosphate reductase [Varunaivibrio sulfuroxidans]|uniref:N-acetyl-gamma-glutamyl-phosphate reductase n=1 Tax=Varunaivibrio sulfuroxidans TaxID=1773489 RepID=A0A4R3JFP5_9PROT|nr:N-acetyl-gamma-glutamyl-phosphate reductase [Varunaivibrio sulfuroxidans]TCS64315.1 N-acetyl-gamma-glutamyl-phosphate reductase [Varunaivibrio sulfuroxidans]WES31249.1 N-acetyl-gamma-glutamyl-phosphate reductase [Varunaivibrio sulfuroxidans]